ncbi:hypothetical protein JCM10207_006182 [Rhodosporidiobolus poonsookiae]
MPRGPPLHGKPTTWTQEEEHTIVQLHEGEGLSYKQISERVKNRSANAIGMRYNMLKQKACEELGIDPDEQKNEWFLVADHDSGYVGFKSKRAIPTTVRQAARAPLAPLSAQPAAKRPRTSDLGCSTSDTASSSDASSNTVLPVFTLPANPAPPPRPMGFPATSSGPTLCVLSTEISNRSYIYCDPVITTALRQARLANPEQAKRARAKRESELYVEIARLWDAQEDAQEELLAIRLEEDKAFAEVYGNESEDEL